jgi:pyruvate/2-oxoglutarate/acetoin dehydrogenase E1 component
VDLRTLKPLDRKTILTSFRKTGRGISVEESPVIGGIGGEIAGLLMEHAFEYIQAPFVRLGAAEQAIPCNPTLERDCFPTADSIAARARQLVQG